MYPSGKRGFTLIELLVVIAIIAILAAILFPVFAKAREKARQTSCLSNVKQITLGFIQYVQDYDERFPLWRTPCWGSGFNGLHWPAQVAPYIKNNQIFQCPSNQRGAWPANCYVPPGTTVPTTQTSYGYNELIQNDCCAITQLAQYIHPAEWILLGDCLNSMAPVHCAGACGWTLPHIAFPKGGWNGGQLQSNPTADYTDLTVHNGGSNIGFVEGHAKWYGYRSIRRIARGGTLRGHPGEDGR